jgi:hypothetical protein
VTDLAKTPEESAAIAETVAALNEFRRIICGLPSLAFPAGRVHVLSEQEFRAKVPVPNRPGMYCKADNGHVYLLRGLPTPIFMAALAHELFHAVSYLWLDLWDRSATPCDGIKWPSMTIRRYGMILRDPSFDTWLPHFHGLNEMVTELASMTIRQMVASRTTLLDDAGKRVLAGMVFSESILASMG